MVESSKNAKRVFISYRRSDNAGVTGRIYDRLIQRFGSDAIFKDIDSIPLGINFRDHLDSSIQECDVVIVVIGDKWMLDDNETGRRRLDDPKDFVRIEIESALQRNIPVIPVLIQNALMPEEESLPPSLRELAARNGITIGHDPHFHVDVDRLIKALELHFEIACSPGNQQIVAGSEDSQDKSSTEQVGVLQDSTLGGGKTGKTARLSSPTGRGAKFVWLAGYLMAAIIGASFLIYMYKKPSNNGKQIVKGGEGAGTVELVTREDLITSLKGAEATILASGFALDMIDSDLINDKVRKYPQFKAKIVLVNPLDTNVICMREQDEKNDRTYGKILLRIRSFHSNAKNLLGNNLTLGVTNTYPTMSVIIVDNDMYTYFFPYNSYGTASPVLRFNNYLKDERAKFFYHHYEEILKGAKQLQTDADYQPYETADLNLRCSPADNK